MSTPIAIMDYGIGNLRSVQKAFEQLGHQAETLDEPGRLREYDRVILPGVGAFGDAMANLHDRGWVQPAQDFARLGRPLMGICLGMQLLMDESTEHGVKRGDPIPGLGLIPGRVEHLHTLWDEAGLSTSDRELKVPHMGWNSLTITAQASPLFDGVQPGDHVYFVHGYACQPANPAHVAATTDYGSPICAAMHADTIWATQFHPEKSQRVGLTLLDNFAKL